MDKSILKDRGFSTRRLCFVSWQWLRITFSNIVGSRLQLSLVLKLRSVYVVICICVCVYFVIDMSETLLTIDGSFLILGYGSDRNESWKSWFPSVLFFRITGTRQLYQESRMIRGIDNVLFSDHSQSKKRQDSASIFDEHLGDVITQRDSSSEVELTTMSFLLLLRPCDNSKRLEV